MMKVKASVVVADYDLLRLDFPSLLGELKDEAIDAWLLETAAYFRISQLQLGTKEGIHDLIETVEQSADQPPVFGFVSNITKRGAVVPVYDKSGSEIVGHLDLKGSGTDSPRFQRMHSDGVHPLRVALEEFFMSKIIAKMSDLVHPNDQFDSLQSYAVLRIPVWYSNPHVYSASENAFASPFPKEELGILVRQVVPRLDSFQAYLAVPLKQLRFEMILLSFGMAGYSNLYDVVYQTLYNPEHVREIVLLDHQVGLGNIWLDFNLIRFAEPNFWTLVGSSTAALISDFMTDCISWPSEKTLKTREECYNQLTRNRPTWSYPAAPCLGVKDYALNATFFTHYIVGRQTDWSSLFPPEKQNEVKDMLREWGITSILTNNPMFYRELNDRLNEALSRWPKVELPIQTRCGGQKFLSVLQSSNSDSHDQVPSLKPTTRELRKMTNRASATFVRKS